MTTRRVRQGEPLPTSADYLARALCPVLIMILVGSLALFAQEVTYSGAHELRLRWLVFWCAIAMVGVSRIAIERTPVYAGIYALILGVVTYAFVNKYYQMPVVGWFILGLIWWCTNKLVYDCTLINEEEDASGEGLLGLAGMDETTSNQPKDPPPETRRPPLWKRLFTNARSRSEQPHAPGLWVLYFSLAAMPIFGLGQLLQQRSGEGDAGMLYVVAYLTSAAGLLMLTSFLGLRRYLRQRRLKMPSAMAVRWIATGTTIIVTLLALSLILPRPVVSAEIGNLKSIIQGKSLEDDHYTDGGEQAEDEVTGESGEPAALNDSADKEMSGDEPRSNEEPDNTGNDEPGSQSPTLNPPTALNSPLVRWLMWGLFAVVALVFAWKHRREIASAIRDLLASLRNLFRGRPNQTIPKRATGQNAEVSATLTSRTFAELQNPFAHGVKSIPPADVVARTFDALEVWAAESGCPRDLQMTANEFARELTHRHPLIKREINRLVALHSGNIYANRTPEREELPPLADLWSYMEGGS